MFQGGFLKTALWALAGIFAIVGYKMLKVDNLEAKQGEYVSKLTSFETRMGQYDRELESVRVESRVSKEVLLDLRARSIRIEQLLLNER